MTTIFFSCSILILSAYLVYPLLLGAFIAFKRTRGTNVLSEMLNDDEKLKNVSIIISAHNEEKSIERKINICQNLDYPKDKYEVIVASDGSTDATEAIVEELAKRYSNLTLVKPGERLGKTGVQNVAASFAKGEFLLFTDSTTDLNRDILRKLLCHFIGNPRIGCVSAHFYYKSEKETSTSIGQKIYWAYEKLIRLGESELGGIIGASGCCYMVRKDAYEPLPLDIISDFCTPLVLRIKGFISKYDPEAIAYEEPNFETKAEFKMRVRVIGRTILGLYRYRRVLNPFKYRFFSIQVIFHKILRYLVPFFVICLYISNMFLLSSSSLKYFFYLHNAFYLAALIGWKFSTRKIGQILSPFYYLFMGNVAVVYALIKVVGGERFILWTPER